MAGSPVDRLPNSAVWLGSFNVGCSGVSAAEDIVAVGGAGISLTRWVLEVVSLNSR